MIYDDPRTFAEPDSSTSVERRVKLNSIVEEEALATKASRTRSALAGRHSARNRAAASRNLDFIIQGFIRIVHS